MKVMDRTIAILILPGIPVTTLRMKVMDRRLPYPKGYKNPVTTLRMKVMDRRSTDACGQYGLLLPSG